MDRYPLVVAFLSFMVSLAGCAENDHHMDLAPNMQVQTEEEVPTRESFCDVSDAVVECTQATKDMTVRQRKLSRAIGALLRVGDPTADESVSYEYAIGGMEVTLTLDSSGWLSLYDSSNPLGTIIAFPDSILQDALRSIRQVVERVKTDEDGIAQVRVIRHFYPNAPGTVRYRNRLTSREYTFECTTEENVISSADLDHVIAIFYATGKW
jgi:hypothetical protein